MTNEKLANNIISATFFWSDRIIVPLIDKKYHITHGEGIYFKIYGAILKHFIETLPYPTNSETATNYYLGLLDYTPQQVWMDNIEKQFGVGVFVEGKCRVVASFEWDLELRAPNFAKPLNNCIPNPVPFFECSDDLLRHYLLGPYVKRS